MATKDITDRQVCEACRDKGKTPLIDFLALQTNQHTNVCFRAIERAIKRDFLDYGVSINRSFLTPKGEALLNESIN